MAPPLWTESLSHEHAFAGGDSSTYALIRFVMRRQATIYPLQLAYQECRTLTLTVLRTVDRELVADWRALYVHATEPALSRATGDC